MKKKYFLNAHIVDPQNSMDEIGGLIINENGKIEAIGKKVNEIIFLLEKNILISRKNIYFQE